MGRGSVEVIFNVVELESWDLWFDCLRFWNDFGMVIRDKLVVVFGYCYSALCFIVLLFDSLIYGYSGFNNLFSVIFFYSEFYG